MYLRVLIEASMSYSFYCYCYRRAPRGRYSCIAQGASPGLIIGIHLLSPFRGGTSCASIGCGRYVVLYLSVGAFACLGKCRSYGAQFAFVCVSPGFHIGLCPHFTLGFAGVPPFQGSLSDCFLFPQGSISGFTLISPWAMRGCRPYRALCTLFLFPQGFISGFALISPWALQEYRPFRAHCCIGRLRCCVVVLRSLNVFGCV